jgi:hypothetical protein
MAATNYILAIYRALWTLAEAHTPTAGKLRVGNEVRMDDGKLTPPKLRLNKQAADFPQVTLRYTGETDTGFEQDPTFSTLDPNVVTSGNSWNEQITLTYQAKVIHDDLRLDVGALFELELKTAIRKGGPTLGLDYVTGWTTNSQTVETDQDPDAMGHLRRVTTLTINVTCLFEGTELIT